MKCVFHSIRKCHGLKKNKSLGLTALNRSMTHLQCSYKWSQPTNILPVGHVLTSLLPFPLMWMGGGVITAVFFICRACGLFLKTLLLSLKDQENIPVNAAFV